MPGSALQCAEKSLKQPETLDRPARLAGSRLSRPQASGIAW
jgi:hypothetical protein